MADSTRIIDGFYKDVPIRIDSGSVSGGRKTVKKEFPNRDTQTIEDLGLRPRSYNLQIVIAPRTTSEGGATNTVQGYFEYRDAIIAAIEDKGPGDLIHPLYGRVENVVATTYSINEDFSDFGRSRLNVTFEVSDDTGIPKQIITASSQLSQANVVVELAVDNFITEAFGVITKFKNNFNDAVDKVTEIIDEAVGATSFIGAVTSQIDGFNSFIGELSADVSSLISLPSSLASSVTNMFSNMDGLFGVVGSTLNSFDDLFGLDDLFGFEDILSGIGGLFGFGNKSSSSSTLSRSVVLNNNAKNKVRAFKGLFGFGNNDQDDIQPTTAGRIERKKNRAVLNGAVNTLALSYSYVAVAQIKFDNVREIEQAADDLEVQYQRVITSGVSNEIIAAVTNMRVLVQKFFDEQKTVAKQITSVNVYTTPARVLSFQYYGESKSADDIIGLNNLTDVSFVDSEVEILTL